MLRGLLYKSNLVAEQNIQFCLPGLWTLRIPPTGLGSMISGESQDGEANHLKLMEDEPPN